MQTQRSCIPSITVLRRLRQEGQEFESALSYMGDLALTAQAGFLSVVVVLCV